MNERIFPYIGVTGFTSPDQVWQVLEVVPPGATRKLMVGVLMSSKTMKGIPNKWPRRYPKPERVADIFIDDPRVLNLIHFNTKEPEKLFEQMIEAAEIGGPNLHGFQLNLKWPWVHPDVLWDYKQRNPGKILVLQAGQTVLEFCEHFPVRLEAAVWYYDNGIVDYLLIDPSGGYGKPFDPKKGIEYLKSLNYVGGRGSRFLRQMEFGIAGGLSSDTLDYLLADIAKGFPNTSIDAEGKLRDTGDNLNIEKAKAYVAKAYAMFGAN